jgi:hypothetical protein
MNPLQARHQDRRNAFPVFNFIQNSSDHRRRLPLVRARYTGPIDYVDITRISCRSSGGVPEIA